MTAFLVIGGAGLLVLLVSLVLGDVIDGAFEGFDALSFDVDGGGALSGPVVGGFLAAFGFGGALGMSVASDRLVAGVAAGAASGLAVGWFAWRITAGLMHMRTDAPVRVDDLLGKLGKVVTPITAGAYGEVTVHHGGQLLKLHAQADGEIPTGTPVVVTAVLSPSSVKVCPESSFFGLGELG